MKEKVSLTLDKDVVEKLEKKAKDEERSQSFIVNRELKESLKKETA